MNKEQLTEKEKEELLKELYLLNGFERAYQEFDYPDLIQWVDNFLRTNRKAATKDLQETLKQCTLTNRAYSEKVNRLENELSKAKEEKELINKIASDYADKVTDLTRVYAKKVIQVNELTEQNKALTKLIVDISKVGGFPMTEESGEVCFRIKKVVEGEKLLQDSKSEEPKYKNPICKGCWSLGNNCKTCEKCIDTKPAIQPLREGKTKSLNKASTGQGRQAPPPKPITDQVKEQSEWISVEEEIKQVLIRLSNFPETLDEEIEVIDTILRSYQLNKKEN